MGVKETAAVARVTVFRWRSASCSIHYRGSNAVRSVSFFRRRIAGIFFDRRGDAFTDDDQTLGEKILGNSLLFS